MDYRVLNTHTVKNKYPIPLVTEQLTCHRRLDCNTRRVGS
jgi:hypothetical protein